MSPDRGRTRIAEAASSPSDPLRRNGGDQGLPAPARFVYQIGVIITSVPVSSAWTISPGPTVHGHVSDVSRAVVVEEQVPRLKIRKRHGCRHCHLIGR